MSLDLLVKGTISSIAEKNKIVLFLSCISEGVFQFSHEGVDAISSPSVMDNKEKVIGKIVDRVNGILNR